MQRPLPDEGTDRNAIGGKGSAKPLLGVVLRAVVSLALLIVLASRIDIPRSLGVIRHARAELLVLLFLMLVVERLYVAYRWHVLLACSKSGAPVGALIRIRFRTSRQPKRPLGALVAISIAC